MRTFHSGWHWFSVVVMCESFSGLVFLLHYYCCYNSLARLMGQYCFARWCLFSVVVCNIAGVRAGGRVGGRPPPG